MATSYQVWYGNDGYTPDETFASEDEALAAIARHTGWDVEEMATSDWYTATVGEDETAERCSVYESQEQCDADQGQMTHQPTITEVA